MALRPTPPRSRARLTRRGRAALRVVATIAFVAAIVLLAANLRADDEAAAPPPDARRVDTPLLSPRRVPTVFVDAVAQQRLLAAATEAAATPGTCLAIDDSIASNGVLVRVNADQPLAPASTTKLLTAAAALDLFGPDHTFTTRVMQDGDDLYVVGGGDPVLTTEAYATRLRETPRTRTDVTHPLSEVADAIAAAGVTEVGTLYADASRHEDVGFLPGWKASYRNDIGELSALTVDDGFAGTTRSSDPAQLTVDRLATLLADRGVSVASTSKGSAPAGAPELVAVASPPLTDIVASMLTSSDNLTAELVVRELGGDGTTATGLQRAQSALEALGVPTAGLDLRDGSGLDAANRVTCDAVLAVLGLGLEPIDRGLAVANETGTLVTRFGGDPLAGILRAKTGQIEDVAGLAGVVDDAEHLRFAFIVNDDFSTSDGQARQAAAARVVAAYPDAPPPQELVPAP